MTAPDSTNALAWAGFSASAFGILPYGSSRTPLEKFQDYPALDSPKAEKE